MNDPKASPEEQHAPARTLREEQVTDVKVERLKLPRVRTGVMAGICAAHDNPEVRPRRLGGR